MATFVRAVDTGSLSAAARALGRSLPTVSRQIAELERHLAVRLLARTTRTLAPTEEGHRFYERARRILEEVEDAERTMSMQATIPSGRLRISSPSLLGRLHLAPLIPPFLDLYPGVSVDLLLRDHPTNLVEEGVDLELRIGALDDSSLVARKLGEVRMVVCVAPLYLARRGVPQSPDDLIHHQCLIFSSETGPAQWSFSGPDGERRTVRLPSARFRSNALDSLMAAAVRGSGVVRAPSWLIASAVAAGALQPVLTAYERPAAPLYGLFVHGRLLAPKVRALLDFLTTRWAPGTFDVPLDPMPQKS